MWDSTGLRTGSIAVYHYDLGFMISSAVSELADDTKVGRLTKTDQDVRQWLGELDNLYDWLGKRQMEFSARNTQGYRT